MPSYDHRAVGKHQRGRLGTDVFRGILVWCGRRDRRLLGRADRATTAAQWPSIRDCRHALALFRYAGTTCWSRALAICTSSEVSSNPRFQHPHSMCA